jgi:hypothetical protein
MDDHKSAGDWAGAAALTIPLILVTLVRADDLGAVFTLLTIGLAVLAGWSLVSWLRIRRDPNASRLRRRKAAGPPVGFTLGVLGVAFTWPTPYEPPPREQPRAAGINFGVKINRHFENVTTRILDRSPTAADADVAQTRGPEAVPVVRFASDGANLTLLVQHNALCEPAAVLFGPGGTDVVVVFARYEKFASDPPESALHCRIGESDMWSWHSTVTVALPTGVTPSTVTDVGASGSARPAR